MNPFRRLDERALPALARGAQQLATRRSRAVLAAALALVLVAAGVSLGLRARGGSQASTCSPGTTAAMTYVGPAAGESAPAYVDRQARLLAACLITRPADRALAVVSLRGTSTPDDAAAVLAGLTVPLVFVAVPVQADTPRILPLTGAGSDPAQLGSAIVAAYATARSEYAAEQRDEQAQSDRATDPVVKAATAAFATSDGLAAEQLQVPCACVYGAVAEGTVAGLAALSTAAVRVVALAPAGTALAALTARPLLPGETGAVAASVPTLLTP